MCQVNISSTLLGSDLTILSVLPHTVRVFGKFVANSLSEGKNLLLFHHAQCHSQLLMSFLHLKQSLRDHPPILPVLRSLMRQ